MDQHISLSFWSNMTKSQPIKMYTHVYPIHNFMDIALDDVPVIMQNLDEFMVPYIAHKDEFTIDTIAVQLCKWYEYEKDTYITATLFVDMNDMTDRHLRIHEGCYCDANKCIIETDGFVDIKIDHEKHMYDAMRDIHDKKLPLINRVDTIDYERFTYVVKDDDV